MHCHIHRSIHEQSSRRCAQRTLCIYLRGMYQVNICHRYVVGRALLFADAMTAVQLPYNIHPTNFVIRQLYRFACNLKTVSICSHLNAFYLTIMCKWTRITSAVRAICWFERVESTYMVAEVTVSYRDPKQIITMRCCVLSGCGYIETY